MIEANRGRDFHQLMLTDLMGFGIDAGTASVLMDAHSDLCPLALRGMCIDAEAPKAEDMATHIIGRIRRGDYSRIMPGRLISPGAACRLLNAGHIS
jgi:hypothetical protein